mmetsp:Transcript_53347/g.85089  ORF Transcript_53347/g.85089 Transcript_53347/m.85089 type:complete len:98 (-) Transcript_53347:15-308(-)
MDMTTQTVQPCHVEAQGAPDGTSMATSRAHQECVKDCEKVTDGELWTCFECLLLSQTAKSCRSCFNSPVFLWAWESSVRSISPKGEDGRQNCLQEQT